MARLTFEGPDLNAILGEMRAFLAMVERPGTGPSEIGGAYVGPALPSCPIHLVEMEYRPAGRNIRTQRAYSASYRCPRPGCRHARWGVSVA